MNVKRSDKIIGLLLGCLPLAFYAGCLLGNPWLWLIGLVGTLCGLTINWALDKHYQYRRRQAAAVRYEPIDSVNPYRGPSFK
jgi:hypothetical protein